MTRPNTRHPRRHTLIAAAVAALPSACSSASLLVYISLSGKLAVASSYTTANTVDLNPSPSKTSDAYAIAGNIQAGGYEGFNPPAVVWSTTAGSAAVPPGSTSPYSHINGTTGVRHVGDFASYATLWTSNSSINLNPAGFSQSHGLGIAGNQQVGWGYLGPDYHALLWYGSAASVVDLTPTNLAGFTETQAFATNGTQQVGRGSGPGTSNINHALLWSGAPNTTVDLHPTNLTAFVASGATGISGTQVVGYGLIGTASNYVTHATLWSGTANSAVDLHPANLAGFDNSYAYATNGSRQVGEGFGTATGGKKTRACLVRFCRLHRRPQCPRPRRSYFFLSPRHRRLR